jgi:predicted TIM-barrel enzyme
MSDDRIRPDMARPEIDDEHIEKMEEIINSSVAVPLPANELSVNQQFRIIIDTVYSELEEAREKGEDAMILTNTEYVED